MDTTALVATIGATTTPINAIGIAVLTVLVSAAVYKWVRRAL